MLETTSFLAPAIQAYVTYQKASVRWNEISYEIIVRFDCYCRENYPEASELTQEMVDNWCRQRDTETNNSCRSRIYPVVIFIRYLRKRGQTTIHEPIIPRREPCTYIPHAFTEEELKNFFAACDNLSNKTPEQQVRRIMIPVFFRLLYSSGLRTYEARMLRREDVDLVHGVLNIRYSKGHQQHYIVLHDSMLELMRQYDAAIRKYYPDSMYFFRQIMALSTKGHGYKEISAICGVDTILDMQPHTISATITHVKISIHGLAKDLNLIINCFI